MDEQFEFLQIAVSQSQIRIDKLLSSQPAIQSRSRAAKLIELGLVRYISGQKISKPSEKPEVGTVIEVQIPKANGNDSELEPFDLDLDIVFEDSDLLVVNKPAGLVVHPAAGHSSDTLVNALVHKVKDLSMGFGERRPGIVHRLDKDTSGLLVVAKKDSTQRELVQQFKAKSVHRVYNALVFGKPKKDSSTIESHLIRHPIHRKKFCSEKLVDGKPPKGKVAITHYQVIEAYPCGLSLLECRLETGRTHQIRVHLSEMGFPLVGDTIYGGDKRVKTLKSVQLRKFIRGLSRIGLHARELGFVHPATKQSLHFQKDWPSDMYAILGYVRK